MEARTFAQALGQACWLMTMSKAHRDAPIHEIERRAALPILLGQFRIYSKDGKPVAFLTWALASDEVAARLAAGETQLAEADWRSGEMITVVDVVSPFGDGAMFRKAFLSKHSSGGM